MPVWSPLLPSWISAEADVQAGPEAAGLQLRASSRWQMPRHKRKTKTSENLGSGTPPQITQINFPDALLPVPINFYIIAPISPFLVANSAGKTGNRRPGLCDQSWARHYTILETSEALVDEADSKK